VAAGQDRNTATQSTRRKIGSPLGCLELHEINTNAPPEKGGLFAHFFRRLPKGIYLKNNILQWQSSKKIERKGKLIFRVWVINLNIVIFLF
jgi:hypothetical protein